MTNYSGANGLRRFAQRAMGLRFSRRSRASTCQVRAEHGFSLTRASAMPQRSDGMRQASGKDVMRLFAPALTLSLADFAVASAQTATPDSENGRYSFNPVANGVLRLDTRTGQVSQCSRGDVGWAARWCRTSARRWRPRSLACRARP